MTELIHTSKTKERNLAFDQTKGLLIILVIIGHIVLGDMQTTPIRMVIYFFHMPLFLAITGYFIKKELLQHSIKTILIKYKDRLILPFAFSFAFYHIIMLFHKDFLTVMKQFFSPYPFYHLWYIPAVILFIFYLKLFDFLINKKAKITILCLSLIFIMLTLYFETHLQWNLHSNLIYQILGDKKFYYFFSYFAAGFLLANHQHTFKKIVPFSGLAILIGLILFNYAIWDYMTGFGKVLTNLGLIIWVLDVCQNQTLPISKVLSRIGSVSLPIYLWHAAPILILQKLPLNTSLYYGLAVLFSVILIAFVIHFENKFPIMNRLVYGKI